MDYVPDEVALRIIVHVRGDFANAHMYQRMHLVIARGSIDTDNSIDTNHSTQSLFALAQSSKRWYALVSESAGVGLCLACTALNFFATRTTPRCAFCRHYLCKGCVNTCCVRKSPTVVQPAIEN